MVKNTVEITQEDLKKMQKLQLEMLHELDRICRKHNIKYNLCGGSLLGAIRHQGFIPWDDDIDIRMYRPEYERFREVCRIELNQDKFYFQNNVDEYDYRWGFARILRNDSTYVRCGQEHLKCRTGVFIDIFPTDTYSDNLILRHYQMGLALFLRKALWAPVGAVIHKKLFLRMWFKLLNKIPKESLLRVQQHLANIGSTSEDARIVCFGLPMNNSKATRWGFARKTMVKKILTREYLEDLIEVPFEGMMVYVPRDYDGWLCATYGTQYMQLPPEEKRVIHHFVTEYKLPE